MLGTLLVVSITLALASAVDALILFGGGAGVNRVYYGTDTRAVSLLTGASLAFALAIFRPTGTTSPATPSAKGSSALGWAGLLALSAVLVEIHYASGASSWLYPFGMVGLDLAVAVIIAAVVLRPGSAVGRIFSVAPARRLGQISYGVYLWHFPLFLWLTAAATGVSGPSLLGLRVAVTLLVSIVSFVMIEQPVRRRRVPNWLVAGLAPIAAGGACAALFAAAAAAAPPLATATLPKPPVRLEGTQACRVTLTDTKQYGVVTALAGGRGGPATGMAGRRRAELGLTHPRYVPYLPAEEGAGDRRLARLLARPWADDRGAPVRRRGR